MSDKLVTVATFWNSVEAGLARSRLEGAGIRTFLADEQMVDMAWYLGNAIGGVKLQVGDDDEDAALDVLSDSDEAASPAELQAAADTSRTVEDDSPARHVDDESNEPEHDPSAREENADRAFRAAIIGLLFWPLLFYAGWLLLTVVSSGEELGPAKRRKAFLAAAITVPSLAVVALITYVTRM